MQGLGCLLLLLLLLLLPLRQRMLPPHYRCWSCPDTFYDGRDDNCHTNTTKKNRIQSIRAQANKRLRCGPAVRGSAPPRFIRVNKPVLPATQVAKAVIFGSAGRGGGLSRRQLRAKKLSLAGKTLRRWSWVVASALPTIVLMPQRQTRDMLPASSLSRRQGADSDAIPAIRGHFV